MQQQSGYNYPPMKSQIKADVSGCLILCQCCAVKLTQYSSRSVWEACPELLADSVILSTKLFFSSYTFQFVSLDLCFLEICAFSFQRSSFWFYQFSFCFFIYLQICHYFPLSYDQFSCVLNVYFNLYCANNISIEQYFETINPLESISYIFMESFHTCKFLILQPLIKSLQDLKFFF